MSDSTPLVQFLTEFRRRLIYCLFLLVLLFSILLFYSNELYTLLALPLLKYLPQGHGLIATNIVASFFVPFELAFFTALFLVIPFLLYQIWNFVAPALYQHEKKLIWPLLLLSIGLFYIGILFAYFVIFPLLFGYLARATPSGVSLSPDIAQYLDLTLKLFLVFGLIFEVPVVIIFLVWTGVITRAELIKMRPYAIVGAFVIGMLVGPPDVLSQICLALPICILYEIGIFISKFFTRTNLFSKIFMKIYRS